MRDEEQEKITMGDLCILPAEFRHLTYRPGLMHDKTFRLLRQLRIMEDAMTERSGLYFPPLREEQMIAQPVPPWV